jgi:hypothetical protein
MLLQVIEITKMALNLKNVLTNHGSRIVQIFEVRHTAEVISVYVSIEDTRNSDRRVAQRRTVISRALEDGEMGGFVGNYWDELHGGCARAYDTDALASELHRLMRPSTRVI